MALLGYIVVVYGFIADEVIFDNSISGQTLAGALTIFVVTVGVTGYKLFFSGTGKKAQEGPDFDIETTQESI